MVSKLRGGVLGSWARGELKEFWHMRSRFGWRKEWTWKFCADSNVWTRWRCRRCYNNIPAGLHEKYRQAVAAKSGEWSTGSSASSGEEDRKARSLEAENKEQKGGGVLRRRGVEGGGEGGFRARLMPWKRRKEYSLDQVFLFEEEETRKMWGEIARNSRMRPSVAVNWMNRGKRCRLSKEMQESLKESVQHQLQDVEKRRNDIMSEHQKVQKWTQKPPGQKKTFAERKLGSKRGNAKKKTERKSIGKKGAFVCCRTKSLNTGWQMRKWKQNFRDCKLENKEEVAMHRKRLISGWRRWWNRSSPWERTRRGRSSMLCVKYSSRDSRLSPLLRRCQEEKKEEEIVKMSKNKAEPVSSWCYQRQAGAIKMHRRVVWSLTFIVLRVHLVKAEVQEDQANKEIAREVHLDHQDGIPWMRKRMTMWEEWCLEQKRS